MLCGVRVNNVIAVKEHGSRTVRGEVRSPERNSNVREAGRVGAIGD